MDPRQQGWGKILHGIKTRGWGVPKRLYGKPAAGRTSGFMMYGEPNFFPNHHYQKKAQIWGGEISKKREYPDTHSGGIPR